jgi:hypothetical protein
MFTAEAVARIDRSVFFLELYGAAPVFEGVRLAELTLSGMWAGIRVRFLPPDPPLNLPKKWAQSSFNAASIELDFGQIKALSLTKFAPAATCSLDLLWRNENFELFATGDVEAHLVAGHCFVQKITGYQKDVRGA